MATFKQWRFGKNSVKYAFYGDDIADAQFKAADKELHRWANKVTTRTVIPLTPKRSGDLRSSFSYEIQGSRKKKMVHLRNLMSYAYWVHEINKNYRVGGYKYLTRAINKDLPGLMGKLGNVYTETAIKFRKLKR